MRDRYGPPSSEMPRYDNRFVSTVHLADACIWTEPARVYQSGIELTFHAISEERSVILDGFEDPLAPDLVKVTVLTMDGYADNCSDPRSPKFDDQQPVLAVKSHTSVPRETMAVMYFSPLPSRGDITLRFQLSSVDSAIEFTVPVMDA